MKLLYNFIIQEVGNKYLAVPVGDKAAAFQTALILDELGAFIMEKLMLHVPRKAILAELMDIYDADANTLSQGIEAFLDSLRQRKVLADD